MLDRRGSCAATDAARQPPDDRLQIMEILIARGFTRRAAVLE
jgi:hypothetical protein